jgi:hypothetical protein
MTAMTAVHRTAERAVTTNGETVCTTVTAALTTDGTGTEEIEAVWTVWLVIWEKWMLRVLVGVSVMVWFIHQVVVGGQVAGSSKLEVVMTVEVLVKYLVVATVTGTDTVVTDSLADAEQITAEEPEVTVPAGVAEKLMLEGSSRGLPSTSKK